MTSVSLFAVVIFLWMRRRALAEWVPSDRFRSFILPAGAAYACAIALVPLLVAQIAILTAQANTENGPPLTDYQKHLPLPVFSGQSFRPGLHAVYSYLALLVALAETACLTVAGIAAVRGVGRHLRSVVVAGAVCLAAVAVCAPAMATTDPYEYIAASLLGFAAYAPAQNALDGTVYGHINHHVRLSGVIYGPLWLAFDTFELGFVPNIVGKLIVLRLVNVALVGALALLIRRAGAPAAAIVVLVLNPAVWYYAVVSPHADLDGLVLLAAGYLAAHRGRPWVATLFLALAGGVKVVFVVAGAAILAPVVGVRRRMLAWLTAATLTLVAATVVPHNAYVSDVARYVGGARFLTRETLTGAWVVVAALAVLVTIALVATGRGVRVAPWFFAQIAPLAAPWYFLWGIPYALATGSLAMLLVSLPLATAFTDPGFDMTPIPQIVVALAILGYLREVVRDSGRKVSPEPPYPGARSPVRGV